jgi:hypothetical protein
LILQNVPAHQSTNAPAADLREYLIFSGFARGSEMRGSESASEVCIEREGFANGNRKQELTFACSSALTFLIKIKLLKIGTTIN